jgi:hypothetical protein
MSLTHRFRTHKILAGAALSLGMLVLAAAPVAGAAGPHITARPTDVMVNSTVSLRGSGFPPGTTLTLAECSTKQWIVPSSLCLTTNTVTVHTNSTGGFKSRMVAEICPPHPPVTPPTQRTCYIGEPVPSGIDTITLVGAAKIVVSWP